MIKRVKYSVKLQEFPSFQFFNGAKEFASQFKDFEAGYSYYAFNLDKDDWKAAEQDLLAKRLQFSRFYEIELTTSEIAAYPAFNLIIPSIYDALESNADGNITINSKAVENLPIAEDFGSNIKIFQENVANILKTLNAEVKFSDPISAKKGSYFLVDAFAELQVPRVLSQVTAIKENGEEYAGTYYMEGWDGRSFINEEGVHFINYHHICSSYLFAYEGKTYHQNFPNYLISGKLAFELKKHFDENIQLTPITFDNA